MSKKYICADDIEYTKQTFCYGHGWYEDEEYVLKEKINEMPAADVVEVVRCKDCDNWKPNGKYGAKGRGACEEFSDAEDGMTRYTGENDYCSYGERKDDCEND